MMKHLRFPTWGYRGTKTEKNKKKCSAGSITLEATIFLTMFILFYVVMLDLIQIVRAQAVLQYAVNSAAKEISVYSYVLTKGGITDKRAGTSETANAFKGKAQELASGLKDVGDILSGNSEGNLIEAVGGLQETGEGLVDEYSEDPKKLVNDGLAVVKQWAANEISAAAIESFVKPRVEANVEAMSNKTADEYLKSLGIVGGTADLDYSRSKWAENKSGNLIELEVVVVYSVEIDLGWIKLPERSYKVCAKTALW